MEIASSTSGNVLPTAVRDPVADALRRPVEHLTRQADNARVQLSAFGRLQATTASLADAAKAAQTTDQPRSAADIRSIARRFVDAVNTGNRVAAEVTATGSRQDAAGALAGDIRARGAASDLRGAVSGARNNGAEELRRIGIDVGRDGTLTINQQRFDQALQSDPAALTQTLDRVGRRVEAAATQQLAAGGGIGRAVESLTARVDSIEARRVEAQSRAEQAQRAIEKPAGAITNNPFLVGGIAAYRGIAGL